MDFKSILIVLLILGLLFLFKTFRVLGENQRFAEFFLGKFIKLIGPGPVFKLTRGETKWVRLSLGDQGEILNPDVARFHAADVPVEGGWQLSPGSRVRIVKFSAKCPVVQLDTSIRRYKCEKCGHEGTM